MNRKGFTLIELMIVIAIIAIIAAIAIPGILAAIRTANERNASGSLKQIGSVQITHKTSDSDCNAINDYWLADVAGLYYLAPTGSSNYVRHIEISMALADGNTVIGASTYPAPNPAHLSSPKSGYWYMAHTGYESAPGVVTAYAQREVDRFSFAAVPNSYGSSGKLVFILSEGGTMWKKDPGASPWTTAPSTGAADTAGALSANYAAMPLNPNGTSSAVAGPWSKME